MFLHHVLSDIDAALKRKDSGLNLYYGDCKTPLPFQYWDYMRETRENLLHAQCFHAGNIEDFISRAQNTRRVGDLFADTTLRLPYKSTWFDWFAETIKMNGRSVTFKRAILAEVIEDEPYTISFTLFDNYTSDRTWSITPVSLVISVTGDLGSSGVLKKLRKGVPHFDMRDDDADKENSVFLFYIGPQFQDVFITLQSQMIVSAYIVEQTLIFLSCKNIVATSIKPPVKLQAKRVKLGKLPLFTYKVLTIKTGTKQNPKYSFNFKFDPKRIHLCMGHYKEYTVEAPLFGKIVGRYFWKPHVRGTNTDGIIIKDYQIKRG